MSANSHVNYNAGIRPKKATGGRRDGAAQSQGTGRGMNETNTISKHPVKENSEVTPGASRQSRNK